MKTRIIEVFSSIQGEGKLLGRRQIFVRFSGCNLECNYCDTIKSRDYFNGEEISVNELFNKINTIKTPDFHSISLTGGEPLLHADFIKEFLDKYYFNVLLETNGSLPYELGKIVDLIKYASVDIKLPEHEAVSEWNDLLNNELESINLLIKEGINTNCKIVVLPSTKVDTVGFIASKLADEVKDISKLSLIIQPSSPLYNWTKNHTKLFRFSEKAGNYLDVFIIPQVHKLLNIR
jgi:7-carboxy-7-deazaguanine synthase